MLSYLATFLVLAGVYNIAKLRLRGQYLMFLADLAWLTYALKSQSYALAIQSVALLCICVMGIKKWRKERIRF